MPLLCASIAVVSDLTRKLNVFRYEHFFVSSLFKYFPLVLFMDLTKYLTSADNDKGLFVLVCLL